jgi:hypothetical protein
MNLQKLLPIILCIALIACGQSKLDRVVLALDAAPLVLSRFNLSGEDNERITDALRLASSKLREYRQNPTQEKWGVVIRTFLEFEESGTFKVSNADAQKWVNEVVEVSKSLMGIEGAESIRRVSARPVMKDGDLKRLELLMKH